MHGVDIKPGDGVICIDARKEAGGLILRVLDSGPGFQTDGPSRTGIGLAATESRLELLYGNDCSIEYGRSNEGGAMVTIKIPFALCTATALTHAVHGSAA